MVGFSIAVAVISLVIANSSSQCSNAKINSQNSIKGYFKMVGICTIISLVLLISTVMVLLCGENI